MHDSKINSVTGSEIVTTQDGMFLVYVIPPDIDIDVRQNGIGLLTQDRKYIQLQNNREARNLSINSDSSIQIVTQNGLVLTTNQELDAA